MYITNTALDADKSISINITDNVNNNRPSNEYIPIIIPYTKVQNFILISFGNADGTLYVTCKNIYTGNLKFEVRAYIIWIKTA